MDFWRLPSPTTQTRWTSFENPTGAKGRGGMENRGAKGHAFDRLEPGETKALMDVEGSGTVHRIWMTIGPRTPKILRGLRLEMTWDGAERPAVSVPMGDFFGHIHGLFPPPFQNELFSSPESRSFVSYVPMPFRKSARITITNESDTAICHLFYDINFTLGDKHGDDMAWFHAHWRRERWTTLGKDFEILPRVTGRGRFIGSHIGILIKPDVRGWFGEGEIKAYLDGDSDWPTLVGTGTEDYIGTAWGQGVFAHRFQGCLLCDNDKGIHSFYRYHIPDPIIFHTNCRVTMQQIGGSFTGDVAGMLKDGVSIQPISFNSAGGDEYRNLLDSPKPVDFGSLPGDGWSNYYRQDDWSATAFFYLDKPVNNLPDLAPVAERQEAVGDPEPPKKEDAPEGSPPEAPAQPER